MKEGKRDALARSLLLYAVTDRHWLGGRTLYDVVRESLEGGVTFLQLREKDLDEGTFFFSMKRLSFRLWPKTTASPLSLMTMWI